VREQAGGQVLESLEILLPQTVGQLAQQQIGAVAHKCLLLGEQHEEQVLELV